MAFRTGVVVGLGVGYVLGAQAGRERYEQIMGLARRATGTSAAQQLGAEVSGAASAAGDAVAAKAQEGVAKVTDLVRSGKEGAEQVADDANVRAATLQTAPPGAGIEEVAASAAIADDLRLPGEATRDEGDLEAAALEEAALGLGGGPLDLPDGTGYRAT